MVSHKLPPLDLNNEVKQFDAHHEMRDVSLNKCDHSKAKVVGNELRCPCGVAFGGGRLNELEALLKK